MTTFAEEIGARLKELFEKKKLKKSAIARQIKRDHSNMLRWFRGENTPDLEAVSELLKAIPSLNAKWLLTGEGEINH